MIGLIHFFINLLFLCLFFRFVSIRKRYYVRGLIMNGILRFTDPLVRPFQSFAGEYSALVAIGAAVAVRGVLIGMFSGVFNWITIGVSLVDFINFSAQVLFLFFCFSYVLSRQGYHATFNVFIEFIHDVAFDCFRLVKKVFRTENLTFLFLASILALIIVFAGIYYIIVNYLFNWVPVTQVASDPQVVVGICIITLLRSLSFFMYVLFFYALMSWFRPDPYAEPVQILNALATPFVSLVRKWFPWASVGMLDLSVLIAIFALYIVQNALINLVSVWLGGL